MYDTQWPVLGAPTFLPRRVVEPAVPVLICLGRAPPILLRAPLLQNGGNRLHDADLARHHALLQMPKMRASSGLSFTAFISNAAERKEKEKPKKR